MRIVNWNVRWATPRSPRRPEILRRMEAHEPEVVCLTETDVALLPWDGHVVCSLADYGYEAPKNRRKVLLWSRQPWRDVDQMGDPDMPPGRFVRATTQTSPGDLTVMGVCIPWSASHTGSAFTPRRAKVGGSPNVPRMSGRTARRHAPATLGSRRRLQPAGPPGARARLVSRRRCTRRSRRA